jgi:hypothetical protein
MVTACEALFAVRVHVALHTGVRAGIAVPQPLSHAFVVADTRYALPGQGVAMGSLGAIGVARAEVRRGVGMLGYRVKRPHLRAASHEHQRDECRGDNAFHGAPATIASASPCAKPFG